MYIIIFVDIAIYAWIRFFFSWMLLVLLNTKKSKQAFLYKLSHLKCSEEQHEHKDDVLHDVQN